MAVTVVNYDERRIGDLIIVRAPKQPIPYGWGNLTQNGDVSPTVEAYRILAHGDRDARDVWGRGALVAVVRGIQYGGSAAPAITTTGRPA
jgi:hypothetical protein